MKTLVMKFGGAAVSRAKSFRHVVQIVQKRKEEYSRIVVVVSAMGKTTDLLLRLAAMVHSAPPRRELDMLISVGERVSISLLAMAFSSVGIDAISFTGSQSGIITTNDHTEARIVQVKPKRVMQHLDAGQVVIVAGFQGMSLSGDITTLGRGGTDTSAVAMAVALGADQVEFYKDVAGVYSNDPKKDVLATHYPILSYEQAIEIMKNGARVLQTRSVELAEHNLMPLYVRSFAHFFSDPSLGTWIGPLCRGERNPVYEIAING